jgi:hypothetical protein
VAAEIATRATQMHLAGLGNGKKARILMKPDDGGMRKGRQETWHGKGDGYKTMMVILIRTCSYRCE